MNDEQETQDVFLPKKEITQMKEEFKVMANALDLEKEQNKSNTESIKKLTDRTVKLEKDLELERQRYGTDSTRKLARDAYNQSTVSANWEGLEEHPFIETICKSLKGLKESLLYRFNHLTDEIGKIPTFGDISKDLERTAIMLGIKADINSHDERISSLCVWQDADRTNGNKQDHKIRDKIANLMLAQDGLEFIQSETILTYDAAMIFVMGAFAAMKYEPVAEGLRIMLKKPKEEPKNDESPS